MGVLVPVEEREDVLRRGAEEAVEPLVGARCIDMPLFWFVLFMEPEAEGWRECEVVTMLRRGSCTALCEYCCIAAAGKVDEEAVREWRCDDCESGIATAG